VPGSTLVNRSLTGLGRVPPQPDLLVALTEGYSAGLLVDSRFAITGVIVAVALIRVDMSQLEEASLAPLAA